MWPASQCCLRKVISIAEQTAARSTRNQISPERRKRATPKGNRHSPDPRPRPPCVEERLAALQTRNSRGTQAQGRIGQAKAETPATATDSFVEQGLEAAGDGGNQGARSKETGPSGSVELPPGALGEVIGPNGEKARAGAMWKLAEESPRGHTRRVEAEATDTATSEGKPSKGDDATGKTGRPRCATREDLRIGAGGNRW
jgi:hypothetical protein